MAKIRKKKKKEPKVIEVHFYYKESARNVYKKAHYFIDGRNVTLRTFKKYFQDYPDIFSANTYFWTPGSVSAMRRSNEERRYNEVEWWLENNGFTIKYSDGWLKGVLYLDKKYKTYKEIIEPILDDIIQMNYTYSLHKFNKNEHARTREFIKIYKYILGKNINTYIPQLNNLLESYKNYIDDCDYDKYKSHIEKFMMETYNGLIAEVKKLLK